MKLENFKIGDNVYCKKNYIGRNGSEFLKGSIYPITASHYGYQKRQYKLSSNNRIYWFDYIYDEKEQSNNVLLLDYFMTIKDSRKLKLEKLKNQ